MGLFSGAGEIAQWLGAHTTFTPKFYSQRLHGVTQALGESDTSGL